MSLRFAPDSPGEAGPQWSHPLELEKNLSSTVRYVSLPVRPAVAQPSGQDAPLIDMGPEEPAPGTSAPEGGPKKKGAYLRELTTLQTAAAPSAELHGLQARVNRRVKQYSRCAKGATHSFCSPTSERRCRVHSATLPWCRPCLACQALPR